MTSYTTLEVQNFKGIREMKLEGLGMVNVFVGGNNVGKTSVLQAIAIVDKGLPSNITIPVFNEEDDEGGYTRINNFELSKHFFGDSLTLDFNHVFYKVPSDEPDVTIELNSVNEYGNFDKKIRFDRNVFPFEKKTCVLRFSIKGKFKSKKYTTAKGIAIINSLSKEAIINQEIEQVKSLTPYQVENYISTENSNYYNIAKVLWYEQVENNREKEVLSHLQNKIEPFLTDIVASDSDLFCGKTMKDMKEGKRIPLLNMGDGFIKLLALACILPNVKKDTLLIDEIENGFHWSVQKDMWRMILTAAKDDGTQFFFTTHSYEVLESLNAVLQEMKDNGDDLKVAPKDAEGNPVTTQEPLDLACVFRLKKDDTDKVTAKKFIGEDLDIILTAGAELR